MTLPACGQAIFFCSQVRFKKDPNLLRGTLAPNTLYSVTFLALGGLSSATNFVPFRQIKRWSWEIYWPVQAFAAWVAAPIVAAWMLVPNCFGILHQAFQSEAHSVWLALLFGMAWGVGGMAFGLAVRYLGIALGYAISLGFYLLFFTLAQVFHFGQMQPPSAGGALAVLGLCVLGVLLSCLAGQRKETEMTLEVKLEAGEQDYHFPKGLGMAALAGLATLFLGLGTGAASPIISLSQEALRAHGGAEIWACLPALVVVLFGGFVTNLVWSAVLVARNGYTKQFLGEPGINPMRAVATSGDTLVDFDPLDPSTYDRLASSTLLANYFFAMLAGVLWSLQFIFYFLSAGSKSEPDLESKMLQISLTLIFAALWGLAVREWRGTTSTTRVLAGFGLILVAAAALLGR